MSRNIIITVLLFISFNIFSDVTHNIIKGDTLYSISKKYDVTIENIKEWNNITDVGSLKVGDTIVVKKENSPVNGATESKSSYKVQKGDTLFSIAKKNNLSLSKILEYNNLEEGDIISLGQLIYYPSVSDNIAKDDNVLIEEETDKDDVPQDEVAPFWPVSGSMKRYTGRIKGIQIEGEPGQYVRAVSNGKVIWYDSYKGIGKVVLVEGDNGYDYLYGTKESLNVRLGSSISAGDKLGRLEENNTSVIFSVFRNGKPLDDVSSAPR